MADLISAIANACEQTAQLSKEYIDGVAKDTKDYMDNVETQVNDFVNGYVESGLVKTVKTVNEKSFRYFVGTQSEYDALSADEKKNLFAIITDDTSKKEIMERLNEVEQTVLGYDEIIASIPDDFTKETLLYGEDYGIAANGANWTTINVDFGDILGKRLKIEFGGKTSGENTWKKIAEVRFDAVDKEVIVDSRVDMEAVSSGTSVLILDCFKVKLVKLNDKYELSFMATHSRYGLGGNTFSTGGAGISIFRIWKVED